MSIFSYLAIAMHFALSSFKKIFNIKNESCMVYCFSAFLFVIAMLPKNIASTTFFESVFYKYVSIIFVFFICSAILLSAYIKKKRELRKGENNLEETS